MVRLLVTVKDGGAPPTSAAPTVRSRARWPRSAPVHAQRGGD